MVATLDIFFTLIYLNVLFMYKVTVTINKFKNSVVISMNDLSYK